MTTESSIVIAPHSGVTMNYDPLKDLVPVSLLTRNTVLLVVHPSVKANTLAEFMALARAQPGQLTYGSSGVGGPNHLAGEIFKKMTGLDIVHVPYQGTGAALQAIIAGEVNAMWGFMAGLLPQVRAGTVRALANGGRDRSPALPDVPTFNEAGVPGYEAVSWVGMFAPQGTSRGDRRQARGRGEDGDGGPERQRRSGEGRLRDRGDAARGFPPGRGE